MTNGVIIKNYLSPCGELITGVWGDKVFLCDWNLERRRKKQNNICRRIESLITEDKQRKDTSEKTSSTVKLLESQLDEYFEGERENFDIDLLFIGTEFQKKVWNILADIPYGKTFSYSEIYENMGIHTGVRAVANAIGANPLSILIPCHRVINKNGTIGGYAGGKETKSFLLKLEKKEKK